MSSSTITQKPLLNKTALVTGAAKGIGAAIARELSSQGARVILHYNQSLDQIRSLATELQAPFIQADLRSADGCAKLITEIIDLEISIDILVNNAGCTNDMLVIQMTEEDWMAPINLNLHATFYLCQAVAKEMMRRKSGSIINITSIAGSSPNRGQANYAASKAAVHAFTVSLAKELAKKKVRCNCVAPGFIDTQMSNSMNPIVFNEIKKAIPMKRLGSPIEVAKVVCFLASDAASYVTGQEWCVDGGLG